jgi:hypothetical protein
LIELAHPLFLILGLPLAVWLWWWAGRSLADLKPAGRRISAVVRGLMLLLVLLALAGVQMLLPGRKVGVLFVVDGSASVSTEARGAATSFIAAALGAKPADALAGVVGFASDAELWVPASASVPLPTTWPTLEKATGTNTARALDFAAALLPADSHRRLILLSDGQDTSDRAAEAANRAHAGGVEISTVPLRNPQSPEVLVERLDVPRQLKTG